ncbi:MAG: hypothetical protein LBL81_02585, partial [Tannerella sp.]|nr:hypothetical protein [Tannerella sp.]
MKSFLKQIQESHLPDSLLPAMKDLQTRSLAAADTPFYRRSSHLLILYYNFKGEYKLGFEEGEAFLRQTTAMADSVGIGKAHFDLSELYNSIGKNEDRLRHLLKASEMPMSPTMRFTVYMGIGEVLALDSKYGEAGVLEP